MLLTTKRYLNNRHKLRNSVKQHLDKKMKTIVTEEQTTPNSLSSVRDALGVIGGKWKLCVIVAVREGNKRFRDIRKSVEGICPKVLSGELRHLEINGLIERTVHTGRPVVVEYAITKYGRSLDSVITAFVEWGMTHRDKCT
jgi:DNA-binding HxlR family transcriptional regulator